MTGMSVQEEAMESADQGDSPYSQSCRRRDPVYLASMAAHALPTSQHIQEMERHHLEQLEQQLQLMHLQHQHQQQHPQQEESCPAMSDHQVPDMETSGLSMS